MDTSISLMGLICRQRREDTLLHVNIGPPWLGNSYWRLDKNLSKLKRRNGNYCKQVKSWYAFCHFHARLNKLKTSVFSKGSLLSSKIQNNLFKLQYQESFQHKSRNTGCFVFLSSSQVKPELLKCSIKSRPRNSKMFNLNSDENESVFCL